MYDFHFGTKDEINADPRAFLIGVKRMLPRWVNSIPDSECLAIYDALDEHVTRESPVLVETGCGASTLAMLLFAMQHNGTLLSWDLSAAKGAFIRNVAHDTLGRQFAQRIWDSWRFVGFSSLSPELGLPILPELVDRVDFAFFDSEHTLDTLLGELRAADPSFVDGSVIAIDDANYDYKHTNYAYINMQRMKLGIGPVEEPTDSRCRPFHVEVPCDLRTRWNRVEALQDSYKDAYRDDLFFAYFNADRTVMDRAGMERLSDLGHRFDVWQVRERA